MAWLEVHQSLLTHRKTLDLADILEVRPVVALGHVISLWLWSLDNAPRGALHVRCTIVARACQWDGDANALCNALIESGFLDTDDNGDIRIHDWDDYAGKLVDKRQANAERMRKARENGRKLTAETSATHVQRTLRARAGATVQNSTVQNQLNILPNEKKESEQSATDVSDDGGNDKSDSDETKSKEPEKWELEFEDFWKKYPRRNGRDRGSKQSAKTAYRGLKVVERVQALKQVVVYAKLPYTLRENGAYIPDAVRWLKEKRWEVVEPEPTVAAGQDSETPPKGYSWARDGEGNWKKLGRDRVTGELPWPNLDVTGNDVLESKLWREYGEAHRPTRPASEGRGRAGGTAA